jgi:4-diphosphocytidyl-2-C-methyl-D-erythritol kinase
MELLSPAKINLHLRVGRLASNGYHPLLSWMCRIGLFDTLELTPTDEGRMDMTCTDPSLACDGSNLVIRAAQAMLELAGDPRRRGLEIRLTKRIPAGGGLGGGSSNAATTLIGLNRLWNMNLDHKSLAEVALRLGSDVPFFLFGPSSVCAGRGEIVTPVAPPMPRWALIVLPGWHLATPRVYRAFDDLEPGPAGALLDEPWEAWSKLTAEQLLPLLANDLEPAAFSICPPLRALRELLETVLGRPVRMSGSGSSLFTLFDTPEQAESAWRVVQRDLAMPAYAAPLAVDAQDIGASGC